MAISVPKEKKRDKNSKKTTTNNSIILVLNYNIRQKYNKNFMI